jgi:hypothetical protein
MLSTTNQYVVLLDACVLAPMPLCDLLLRLAEEPAFFVPRWSADVLREVRSTLRKFGYSEGQAERRLIAMRSAFEDAEVSGYECLQSAMTNHPKDRHILAAAVRCGAHAICTDNKRDFPSESLSPYNLDCLTSDEFLVHQFHLAPELVLDKLEMQAKKRDISLAGLLMRLSCGAPKFAQLALSEYSENSGK